jgi:RsiW-degrading membrane proteinase PrsW (M82 family)
VDGIVYGAAAGLGLATLLNLQYVLGSGGVKLDVGVLRVTVTALAHASFGGALGYFLGRAKFENMGPAWLPLGLLLAAVLNGCVTFALGWVARRGLEVLPLNRLAVAAGVAVITFGVLMALMRRLTAADQAADGGKA